MKPFTAFRRASVVAALLWPILLAGPARGTGTRPAPFLVWDGSAPASDALGMLSALAGMERYCAGHQCVAHPRGEADVAALFDLATRGLATIEPYPAARQIAFAKATWDVDSRSYSRDFPGRNEVSTSSSTGQWAIVFKAFLQPEWRAAIERAGLFLGGPVGPTAYHLYGEREALSTYLPTAAHVAGVLEIPNGLKRSYIDVPLAGDEVDSPRFTVVELFRTVGTPSYALLESKLGAAPQVIFRSQYSISYGLVLTRDEATYLSQFPDVVSISREVPRAGPSDERSNRIVAGGFQVHGSSWPLTLPENSASSPHWDSYLADVLNLVQPESQTIAFLDTGLSTTPLAPGSCPPELLNPVTGECSLTLATTSSGAEVRSVLDYLANPVNRGADFYPHGTLTTAVAAGFLRAGGSQPARDAEGYAFGQGIAPGARIAMSKVFDEGSCAEEVQPKRKFRGDAGDLAVSVNWLRYSLVALSQPVSAVPLAEFVFGAGASLYNHSWNAYTGAYEQLDMILDESARSQSAHSFDFGTDGGSANKITGGASAATHIVSAGNRALHVVGSPGLAKNVITVGATETFNQVVAFNPPPPPSNPCVGLGANEADNTHQMAAYNSSGTPSGRLKPEFVAPGNRVYGPLSAARDPQVTPDCPSLDAGCARAVIGHESEFAVTRGTSFAAPVAAGVAALVRAWREGVPGGSAPSPALLKAILAVGAKSLVTYVEPNGRCCYEHLDSGNNLTLTCWEECGNMGPAPDPVQGWGGISLERFFRSEDNYRFVEQGTESGSGDTVLGVGGQWTSDELTVVDPTRPVRIALAWTDPLSGSVADGELVNDLDLEVHAVSECPTYVWRGNLTGSREFSVRNPEEGSEGDRKNNLETVVIDAQGKGGGLPVGITKVRVVVKGRAMAGAPQDFALAVENAH